MLNGNVTCHYFSALNTGFETANVVETGWRYLCDLMLEIVILLIQPMNKALPESDRR